MMTGWQTKTLGEVCDFLDDGDWIETKDQSHEGIRLIQTGNIGDGEFLNKINHVRFISESTFIRLQCKEIFPGDILISRLPEPVGRSCVVPDIHQRMITAVDCSIARINEKSCLKKFFVYYSQSKRYSFLVSQLCTGAIRARISRKKLETIPIPVPPLDEQERIVGILDDAFEKIDAVKRNAEQNLANAKELFQSILDEMIAKPKPDWQTKTLGEVCEIISGATPLTSEKRFWNGNLPWITPAEIVENMVYVNTSKRCISQVGADSCSLRLMPKGTVIFTSRAPIGKVAILNIECYCNQGFKNFICGDSIYNKYLFYFLKGNVEYLNSLGKGIIFKEISKKIAKTIPIPLPPLDEQKRIIKILDEAFEKIDVIIQDLEKIMLRTIELKQQILTKAFRGEL